MRPITLTLATLATLASASGAPNRYHLYPNSNLEVQALHTGPDGLLWIAAKDGLHRFDGLRFHKIAAYPFPSADFLGSTSDGSLWIAGQHGLVRMTPDGRFHSRLNEPVQGLATSSDEVFLRTASKLLRFPANSTASPTPIEPAGHFRLATDSNGDLFYVLGLEVYRLSRGAARAFHFDTVPPGLSGTDWQVIPGTKGTLWFSDGTTAFSNADPTATMRRDLPNGPMGSAALAPGRNSHVWIQSRNAHRMEPPADWIRLPRVPSQTPVRASHEDPQGHFWMALPEVGLIELIEDANWERWPSSGFGGKSIAQVTRVPSGPLVAATFRRGLGGLWTFDLANRKWTALTGPIRDFRNILALPDGTFLTVQSQGPLELFSAQGTLLRQYSSLPGYIVRLVPDPRGQVWAVHDHGLIELLWNPSSQDISHREVPVPFNHLDPRIADMEVDLGGRLWIATVLGLACLDQSGQWTTVEPTIPIRDVASIALDHSPDPQEIWVAYQGGSQVARLHRSGRTWTVDQVPTEAAHSTIQTSFVRRDSRGWVWQGTEAGLRVSDGIHIAPGDWILLSRDQSLAGEAVAPRGFFEDVEGDGNIWIATSDGVTRIHPTNSWFEPRPIRLSRVVQNGAEVSLGVPKLPDSFPDNIRDLDFEFSLPSEPGPRNGPLQYRLLPSQPDWRTMENAILHIPAPSNGDYRLEVSLPGSLRAPALQYTFHVGPTFSRFLWLLLPVVVLPVLLWNNIWMLRLRFRCAKLIFLLRVRVGGSRGDYERNEPELDATPTSGQILIDRYRLLHRISSGGFATVYAAEDLAQERDDDSETPLVAVKLLYHRAGLAHWVKDRYAHEVAALQSLHHPGVLPILDSGFTPSGEFYIISPLLVGRTLREAIQQGPLEDARAAYLIRSIGDTLTAIHQRGVIHRDLKPENIYLQHTAQDGEFPVLLDFGSASFLGREQHGGDTRILTGSVDYMAPEQLHHRFYPATDIFSFGVVVLEILTSRRWNQLTANLASSDLGALQQAFLEAGRPTPDLLATELLPLFSLDPTARPADAATWAMRYGSILLQHVRPEPVEGEL